MTLHRGSGFARFARGRAIDPLVSIHPRACTSCLPKGDHIVTRSESFPWKFPNNFIGTLAPCQCANSVSRRTSTQNKIGTPFPSPHRRQPLAFPNSSLVEGEVGQRFQNSTRSCTHSLCSYELSFELLLPCNNFILSRVAEPVQNKHLNQFN